MKVPLRITAIDLLRALTMFLMIWVNDFWTLDAVPKWLQHASAQEDYLGFSDIIFPLFLFIMGLSLPWAIENRERLGNSRGIMVCHILIRSGSLLLMGWFMVNQEHLHAESLPISKDTWGILMALALSFLWMDWNRASVSSKWATGFRSVGGALLLYLAVVYRGGEDGTAGMRPYWWGILGLLGWAYLANSLLYLGVRGRFGPLVGIWLGFNVLNLLSTAGFLKVSGFGSHFSPIYSGSCPAFTAAGVVAAVLFRRHATSGSRRTGYAWMIGLGLLCLLYGFALRPEWGISKIRATPAWVGICTGIGFLSFAGFYWMADLKRWTQWARPIRVAGTATLTCYLIPYFLYPIRSWSGLQVPELFRTGVLGLLTAFAFAGLVILLVQGLEKFRLRLKL